MFGFCVLQHTILQFGLCVLQHTILQFGLCVLQHTILQFKIQISRKLRSVDRLTITTVSVERFRLLDMNVRNVGSICHLPVATSQLQQPQTSHGADRSATMDTPALNELL